MFSSEQLPWRGTSRRPSDHEITFGSDPDNIFEQELREKVWGGKFPFLVVVRNWVFDRSVREQSVVGDSEPGSHEILPTCQRNPTCWSREIRPTCQKQRAVQRNPCNADCKRQKSTQPAALRRSTIQRSEKTFLQFVSLQIKCKVFIRKYFLLTTFRSIKYQIFDALDFLFSRNSIMNKWKTIVIKDETRMICQKDIADCFWT